MPKAEVLGPWAQVAMSDFGGALVNVPKVTRDYALDRCRDVTATPSGNLSPAPNLVCVEVTAPLAVLAAIAADAGYRILWHEGLREQNDPMPDAEHTALLTALAAKTGLTAPQVATVMGATAAGRTREQIIQLLRLWLRARPKGP